ncbi:hypothetical protein BH11PSE11_BH11PSE11_18400 [soil metagenome]
MNSESTVAAAQKSALSIVFEAEMKVARRLIDEGALDAAFARLEIAHVLGQRHVGRHVRSHWLMLKIGYQRRSTREIGGQLLRIILGAAGSSIGVVPTGNTGGTNISMFRQLPVSPELQILLKQRP